MKCRLCSLWDHFFQLFFTFTCGYRSIICSVIYVKIIFVNLTAISYFLLISLCTIIEIRVVSKGVYRYLIIKLIMCNSVVVFVFVFFCHNKILWFTKAVKQLFHFLYIEMYLS